MIDNIIFKILPAGEGKTRWLVSKAFDAANEGKEVYALTNDYKEFEKLVLKYRNEFAMFCPIKMAENINEIPQGSIVLIDNLIKRHMDIDFEALKNIASKIYVTITGMVE